MALCKSAIVGLRVHVGCDFSKPGCPLLQNGTIGFGENTNGKALDNSKESQAYKIVPLIFVSKVTEELVCLSILSLIAIPSIFFKNRLEGCVGSPVSKSRRNVVSISLISELLSIYPFTPQ